MADDSDNSTIGWDFIAAQAAAIRELARDVSENDSTFRLIERRSAIEMCATEIGHTLTAMRMVGGFEANGEWRRK